MTLARDDHGCGAQPEDPQGDEGVITHRALGDQEGDHADGTDRVADHRSTGVPAPLATLLGHGQERHQGHHEGHGTPPVDPGLPAYVVEVKVAVHHEEGGDPDRDVDQEDPPPAGDPQDRFLPGEKTAGDRPQHARGCEHGHEVAGVLRTLPRRDDVTDDRQHEREQSTGAQALKGPQPGQHVHRVGERARGRSEDEQADREQEQLLAPVEVAELSVDRGGDRRGDQVRRGDPGLDGQAVRSSAMVRIDVATMDWSRAARNIPSRRPERMVRIWAWVYSPVSSSLACPPPERAVVAVIQTCPSESGPVRQTVVAYNRLGNGTAGS